MEKRYHDVINHNGQTIVFLNLANLTDAEIPAAVEEVKATIKLYAANSVLLLTDMTNMHYGKESLEIGKEFTKDNKNYVKKSALIGIDGLKKIAFSTLVSFSGRDNLKIFNTKEEALEWLVTD